jgi:hypothetical protein
MKLRFPSNDVLTTRNEACAKKKGASGAAVAMKNIAWLVYSQAKGRWIHGFCGWR